jgi:hypothetical protein
LTVTLRVGTSSGDWVTHTFPVNRGANTLTADAAVNVTTLDVSGAITRNGDPITAPVTVYVRSYNAANNLLAVSSHYVSSDGDNRYTLPPIVAPTGTVTVRTQAEVSPFDYDDIVNTYTGIGAGMNSITFDIVDVATTLRLSGVLTRGGDPFIDPFTMRVTYTATPYSQYWTYTIDPDDDVHYELATLVPDNTTLADVVYVLPSGTDPSFDSGFDTQLSGFLAGTDNAREHSIEWTPRLLAISGQVLIDDGIAAHPPADYVTLGIEFLDADGTSLGAQAETLWDLDGEDGTYATTAQPPPDATQTVVTIEMGPVYDWFTQTVDLLPAGQTDVTADARYHPVVYTASGQIRQLGIPADLVRAEVVAFGADGQEIARLSDDVALVEDADGTFSISLQPVPRLAVRIEACISHRLTGEDGLQTRCGGFDSLTGNDIDDQVIIDTQGLRLIGRLIDQHGAPITAADRISVEVEELDADGAPVGGFGVLVQAKDFAPDGSLDMLVQPNIKARVVRFHFGSGELIEMELPGTPTVTDLDIGTYTYLPPP